MPTQARACQADRRQEWDLKARPSGSRPGTFFGEGRIVGFVWDGGSVRALVRSLCCLHNPMLVRYGLPSWDGTGPCVSKVDRFLPAPTFGPPVRAVGPRRRPDHVRNRYSVERVMAT